MAVILARDGACLKLPEKTWLTILALVMDEGWSRADAHKLTYEDFKLLLPDPRDEAERRKRGGYRIGAEDAFAFAEAVLRVSEKLHPEGISGEALLPGLPPRSLLQQLETFCRRGGFAITMALADDTTAGKAQPDR